jgi:hypothetical protein
MKKNHAWLLIVLVIAAMVAVVLWRRPVQPTPPTTPTQKAMQSSNFPANALSTNGAVNIVSNSVSNPPLLSQYQATNSRLEKLKQILEQKNIPITFYGRVLDQDGNGIAGVQIVLHVRQWHLDATADPWGNKFPKFERVTDSNGNFSLENTSGDSLSIESVSKEGYQLSPKAPNGFGYGSENVPDPIHPDPQNPVIIRMWKLGESAKLISNRTLFGFQPDGRVYTLDLLADKKESGSANGDLRIQFQRQSVLKPKEIYPWSLDISAIDGGLVETTDEFEYVAPESGYQPQILFQTNSISPKAMPDVTKDYYFASRNGQVYGVISLQIFSDYNGQSAILVNSRINPNGSRNLQP